MKPWRARSLDEFYNHSEEELEDFRRWARHDFDAAVCEAIMDLRQVIRYAQERAEEKQTRKILTDAEASQAYEDLKKLRREVEKAQAKNLLTDNDKELLDRLLKGEIGLQQLDPNTDNIKGIEAVYKAKLAYEELNQLLIAHKRSIRKKRLEEADRHLETARKWKDKKAGFLYARETMRRNVLDIVTDKKAAEALLQSYFEPVQVSEAAATRFRNEYRERVRKLELSRKVQKGNEVSEAHAVQLLGEAMDNIRVMEKSRGRMKTRDGKTLAEWKAVVQDLWDSNPELDRKKIEAAVGEFRKNYDELLQAMNRIRVANGYEPVNYRQGYFPHFQPGGDGIMAFFGKALGIDTQVDALPTSINGLTHTFKPGIQWFGNAQERLGFNTAYDAVEGFDKYIEGVASVIYHTENIQKLRALSTQIRYRTSDEGIRKQVDAIRADDRLSDDEKTREINALFEHGKFSLSNFVAELDEYTNLLANKKSKYDRSMEHLMGRRMYTFMKKWEAQVGANMIAGNLGSALTNVIPLTQAGAQLSSDTFLRGMWDSLRNMKQTDGFAGRSDFLTNRRGSDPLVKTWVQTASGWAGKPMELIDGFTSEAIVRAAYYQNVKLGLSETEAMHQADLFAAGVMADRSKGSMPTLFESRNPIFKAFTQFQLEVNNQFSEIFKDVPRRFREKGLHVLALVFLKYFLGAWLYNELYEKLFGRRSALDPFGILNDTAGDLTGYELPNLFDMAQSAIAGEDISFETEQVGVGEAGKNLAANLLSELPFSAGLNLIGIETDGGRLPAASAVPDLSAIWDAAAGRDLTGKQRWKALKDELNKLAYVIPPFGGGQISKMWKGIDAYIRGGSYGLNQKGEEILQYPVYNDEPGDAFWNLVRAALMGKSALPEARQWTESGFDSLNAMETAVYKDLLDAGVQDRAAFGIIKEVSGITSSNPGSQKHQRTEAVFQSDLDADAKAVAYYGLIASDKERENMNILTDAGATPGAAAVTVKDLYAADKLRGAEKKEQQEQIMLDSALTEEEKHIAMQFILGDELETETGKPSAYAKYLCAVDQGMTNEAYMAMRTANGSIDEYFEFTDAGLDPENATEIIVGLSKLQPEDGEEEVSWYQECEVILDAGMSERAQVAALEVVSYPATGRKIRIGYECGLTPGALVWLKQILPDFDENGSGSFSQAEVTAAIDAINGDDNPLFAMTGTSPHGFVLSNEERAVLWQLQTDAKDGKKNPYDPEIGKKVYDLVHADD